MITPEFIQNFPYNCRVTVGTQYGWVDEWIGEHVEHGLGEDEEGNDCDYLILHRKGGIQMWIPVREITSIKMEFK